MHEEHYRIFNDELEAKAKRIQDYRNKKFNENNNRDEVSPNRWIGTLGEFTLKNWFDISPFRYEYRHNFAIEERDETDFDFGCAHIDVKIQGKQKPPTEWDWLYVYERQLNRMYERGLTNVLVFGFYEFPTKKCSLCGFITMEEFCQHAQHFGAGECRSQYGFPLSTPEWSVPYKYAVQQGILRPLIELDMLK